MTGRGASEAGYVVGQHTTTTEKESRDGSTLTATRGPHECEKKKKKYVEAKNNSGQKHEGNMKMHFPANRRHG